MSFQPKIDRFPFTLAAGADIRPKWSCDFLRFDTLPAGLQVGWNGSDPTPQVQGSQISGVAGENSIRDIVIVNKSGGALTGLLLYGLGEYRVEGVVTLTGSVPLATGAATEAKQDTGNTSLASILAGLAALATHALQTTANAILTTSNAAVVSIDGKTPAANVAVTPRVLDFNPSGDVDVTGARQIDILNTHATISVTITIAGQPNFTLGPGKGVGWPMLNPQNAGYPQIRVTSPAAATGSISYVL